MSKKMRHTTWVPLGAVGVLLFIAAPWLLILALPFLVPLAVYAMYRVRHPHRDRYDDHGHGGHHHHA
ncbi:MAG: hypothetical protein R3B36_04685 [Polyangiaceae bacterium]